MMFSQLLPSMMTSNIRLFMGTSGPKKLVSLSLIFLLWCYHQSPNDIGRLDFIIIICVVFSISLAAASIFFIFSFPFHHVNALSGGKLLDKWPDWLHLKSFPSMVWHKIKILLDFPPSYFFFLLLSYRLLFIKFIGASNFELLRIGLIVLVAEVSVRCP